MIIIHHKTDFLEISFMMFLEENRCLILFSLDASAILEDSTMRLTATFKSVSLPSVVLGVLMFALRLESLVGRIIGFMTVANCDNSRVRGFFFMVPLLGSPIVPYELILSLHTMLFESVLNPPKLHWAYLMQHFPVCLP